MNSLEHLESRIAPAIVAPTVSKGVLLIQHDSNSSTAEDLTVTQTGPTTFTVHDATASADFGPFPGVTGISVDLGGKGDSLAVKISADGLAGNLSISASAGDNNITLSSVDGNSGKVGGKVKITGGTGSDSVFVDGGLALASAVNFDGGDGNDSFTPNNAFFAKKLTLTSVENITTQGTAPVVIGGLLVENEHASAPVTFVLSNISVIAGSLTYCGSATVADDVTLNGQVTGPAKLMLLDGVNTVNTAGTFASSLGITGGSGKDTVTFHTVSLALAGPPGTGPFITANVAGALKMQVGAGDNTVTFDGNSYFGNGVAVATGVGADTVNCTEFICMKDFKLALGNGVNAVNGSSSAQNYVGGNFKYTGGSDADTVDLNQLVAGNINVTLGDGANTVTGTARIVGKSASFTGGAGVDNISIFLAGTAGSLSAKLGAGNDSFTLTGGALASVTLDGGAGTNDVFSGLALLPVKNKLTGFETET